MRWKNILLVFVFIVLITPIVLYFIVFHGELSIDANDWICFGTIWGGTLSAALAGISLIIFAREYVANEESNRYQQVISFYQTQLNKIQYFESKQENAASFISYFVHFNRLMQTEIYNGLFSLFLEYLKKYDILDYKNSLLNFFMQYIASDINLDNEIIIKYFENDKQLYDDEYLKIRFAWTQCDVSTIENNPIKTIKYNNKFIPSSFDSIFESLVEDFTADNAKICELYREAFRNVTIKTSGILIPFFICHKKSVKILMHNSENLNAYFNQMSNEEKKAIYYFLIYEGEKTLIKAHLANDFQYEIEKYSIYDKKYIKHFSNNDTEFCNTDIFIYGFKKFEVLKKFLKSIGLKK